MQSLLYDGSFEGFLCAVFDVYYYKYSNPDIIRESRFNGNLFGDAHTVHLNEANRERIWTGLQKKLTREAQDAVYRTFLSEEAGIENTLLQYIQYVFSSPLFMENDFSNDAVLTVTQTAKKVWREKHRMEAFVRFQKTADDLYYSIIEPDYNVLPLLSTHFTRRYADQRWLIYDARRKQGIYFDKTEVADVQLDFSQETERGKNIAAVFDAKEEMYQELWQQYFKSVNIAARKNTKLHLQHMPKRYWKYLPEKMPANGR
jgi:probable DNA metabolism protein